MANAILDAVWLNQPFYRLPLRPLAMLAFLADKADPLHRESWYSQPEMARVFQCSVKTVYSTLEYLRSRGYIEKVMCNGVTCKGHPHRKTPHYRVARLHGERTATATAPPVKSRKRSGSDSGQPDRVEPPKRPRGRPRKQALTYDPPQPKQTSRRKRQTA